MKTKKIRLRILIVSTCMLVMCFSCKKEPNGPQEKKATTAEKYNEWRSKHALIAECNDEVHRFSEKKHNIKDPAYFIYLANRHHINLNSSGHPNTQFFPFPWKTITNYMEEHYIECYDGWLKLTYDVTAASVTFSRADYFSNNEIMYPHPLFAGIEKRIKDEVGPNAEPLEIIFTNAICPVKQAGNYVDLPKLIFKIRYKDSSNKDKFLYYDMSDDPT